MRKHTQPQRRKIALPTLDRAVLVHVTGGGATGLPTGQRQHDKPSLGEKGPWDQA